MNDNKLLHHDRKFDGRKVDENHEVIDKTPIYHGLMNEKGPNVFRGLDSRTGLTH